MKNNSNYARPSLAQLFESPVGFKGKFGWLCGYSGDRAFLNDAADRFTQLSKEQRAQSGRISLAIMLDKHNPQITTKDVPGVYHLPIIAEQDSQFRLLHAKVAILLFCSDDSSDDYIIRLIVSTGNWTQSTLEYSLDLAWYTEYSNKVLSKNNDKNSQARTDIKAAWNMMAWLRQMFDTRMLTYIPANRETTETSDLYNQFEQKINYIRPARGFYSTFIDNRKTSLFSIIIDNLKRDSLIFRNYIGIGSGFYESECNNSGIPTVIRRINDDLTKNALLTKSAIKDVFINQNACQAIANSSIESMRNFGWTLREAGIPDYYKNHKRSLHAKFIISYNFRESNNTANSIWVYLGSGNLTKPGFINKASTSAGNLEAGVFLYADKLYRMPERNIDDDNVIKNLLPVQWDTEIVDLAEVYAGSKGETEITFIAPPIPYFNWYENNGLCYLITNEQSSVPYDILDLSGNPCVRKTDQTFIWVGIQPHHVKIRWVFDHIEYIAFVPIIDNYGRISTVPLKPINFNDAWNQLDNFPLPPEPEDIDDSESFPDFDPHNQIELTVTAKQYLQPSQSDYPIRRMMELIENIASKQTHVLKLDWNIWCIRLEQCLSQIKDDIVVKEFISLGINPISPLWEKPFRPDYAETNETDEGKKYEAVLKRIEVNWGVEKNEKIGK